jgi:hypothetical protein
MPAGSRVNYTYTISNPGNVQVNNIAIVAPTVGLLVCNGTTMAGNPSSIATLLVYGVVECK